MKEFTGVRSDLPEWERLAVQVGRGVLCRFDRHLRVFPRVCGGTGLAGKGGVHRASATPPSRGGERPPGRYPVEPHQRRVQSTLATPDAHVGGRGAVPVSGPPAGDCRAGTVSTATGRAVDRTAGFISDAFGFECLGHNAISVCVGSFDPFRTLRDAHNVCKFQVRFGPPSAPGVFPRVCGGNLLAGQGGSSCSRHSANSVRR